MPAHPPIHQLLSPREHAAALELVRRVRGEVPALLWRALLFGSRARGDARRDSDLDLLLIFRALPPDREPQAAMAERLADGVGAAHRLPLSVWCVSLPDLRRGCRTPMLVDALDDGVPLWPAGSPPLRLAYTRLDARFCVAALLDRVDEGGEAAAAAFARGEPGRAARRMRDDLVRLCTAALLLRGDTRPRRAAAVLRFSRLGEPPRWLAPQLAWAARSYGPAGRAEEGWVAPPPGGFRAAAAALARLGREVGRRASALERRVR